MSKGRLVGRSYVFSLYSTILFNVYYGKFVMTFIHIGENDCMSMPKCHWMVIVVNLVKLDFFLQMMLTVGVVLSMSDQYQVLPPLAAIIATRRRSMLVTRRCRRSTGEPAHSSSRIWRSSSRFWSGLPCWWLHHPIHPKMFYGVAVWRSCRLFHLGDIALLKEIKDYPSMARCGVIVLVAVVIPKILPAK